MVYHILFIYVLLLTRFEESSARKDPLRVAVIGSGIGGSSAAHYLLKNENVNVDLYERDTRVGGRVYSEKIENTIIDFGASFFIKENKLIFTLVNELQIESKPSPDDRSIGFVSGRKISFQLGSSKFVNIAKVIWRYGLTPIKLNYYLGKELTKFLTIYNHLEQKTVFTGLSEMLKKIELEGLVSVTIEDYLRELGASDLYIEEFINGFIAGIYNQHKEINGFAGFVNLIGVNYKPLSIVGGNNVVIKKLVENLKITKKSHFNLFLNQTVTELNKTSTGYILTTVEGTKEYDVVIIACPITKTQIKLTGLEHFEGKNNEPVNLQRTHVTVVSGKLSNKFFGTEGELPTLFLITNKLACFNITDIIVTDDGHVKIQSDGNLSEVIKHQGLFEPGYKILKEHQWDFAYPKLIPFKSENNLPKFKLQDGLYYINAIEVAASCMELSLISSRNIVNMVELEYLNVTAPSKAQGEL